MHCILERGLECRAGTTAIEYTLIAAIISIAIIGALNTIAPALNSDLDAATSVVRNAAPAP